MSKPSDELLKKALEFAAKHPDYSGKRSRLDMAEISLCAQFAEQIVRECAEITSTEYDGVYSRAILQRFGLKE